MSLLEQQIFTARLLTDESLRRDFLLDPEKVGLENNLDESEIGNLKSLAASGIASFADSLVHKRRHETEKLLPLTKKVLGADFRPLFNEFSQTFTPQTTKKHYEDALAFADFLAKRRTTESWISEIAKYEFLRLDFSGHSKRFAIGIFAYDIRRIIENAVLGHEKIEKYGKRRTVAVWLRYGEKTIHRIF
jgi:hypothetical protein